MKKLLIVLILFTCSIPVMAQDLPLIDVGLKAGGNSSWLRGLPLGFERDGRDFGFVGGAWARVNVPGIGLFAQPEAVFSQTGGSFTVDGLSGSTEIRMTSFDIPVILGKKFGFGPLGLRIGAGPVFSSILSAKLENNDVGELDLKDTDAINSFQINLQAGVGIDISKLAIDLRYFHGLSSIYEDNFDITDDQGTVIGNLGDIKVSGFQLTLGYKLF